MKVFIVADLPEELRRVLERACAEAGVALPKEITVDDGRGTMHPPPCVEELRAIRAQLDRSIIHLPKELDPSP